MKKYYSDDTGGRYLVGACGVGYFADVQTVAQAEDVARMWWAMTGDDGGVIIWSREKEGVVKVMRRDAGEGKAEKTDREKIIELVAPYVSAYGEDEAIADAIIAAGFRRKNKMAEMWVFAVMDSSYDDGFYDVNVTLFTNEEAALRYYDVIIENEKFIFEDVAFTEQGDLRDGYTLETGDYNMHYWCLKNNATGEFSEVKIVPTQIYQHFDDETEV